MTDKNDNNKNNDTLIKLEALEKEYEVTLNQYQEALNSYITALKQPNGFVSLKGRAYWGTSGLTQGTADSEAICESMCKADSKCTGATYNEKQHYCWVRQGKSNVTTASNDSYAILTQDKALLARLQYFNDKLTQLSQQIMDNLYIVKPYLKETHNENNEKQNQIQLHYVSLKQQQKEIEKELAEYMALENEYQSQQLYANQNNVSLRIWVLITCIILLITLKNMLGLDSFPISLLFWVGIICLLIILSFSLTQPAGFLMWGVAILYIILSQIL